MQHLDGVVQPYAWGSTTAIPELLGVEPDGRPQAELWLGAHPGGCATVAGVPLATLVEVDPGSALGADAAARFGTRLPFLLKVLAAASPLSLQVHPTAQQAAAGFADEAGAGVPLDAPHRRYRDPDHKPELLCALTPFAALCGFRAPEATLELLAGWGLADLPAFAPLHDGDLAAAVRSVLAAPPGEGEDLASRVAAALEGAPGPEAAWGRRIAAARPGDPGLAVALLLHLVELEPGQAIFLGPGRMHAYLGGVGVELMASSDNVLRCGLTDKHVDVDEVLAVLDPVAGPPPVVLPTTSGPVRRYETPAGEFELLLVDLDGATVPVPATGPRIVLVLEGAATAASRAGELALARGRAAWIPAADGPLSLRGRGRVAVAHVP